ncbi:Nucleotide-binding protein [Fasciola hepatica]|uniref:Nucleotide-binding protein n=1 Tax=Fasciola hepatica TaxID=6192 RepID=A0A4E0R0R3_FASHE|nr:Nucleotide-binding protein [Fasciola hepatica]
MHIYRRIVSTLGGYALPFVPKGFIHEAKRSAASKLPLAGVENVVLVTSAKGGVGKSTVSVNLAAAIKELLSTEHVGLLDADVFGPSIPKMMGLEGIQPDVDEKNRIIPLQSFGIKCMSMGSLVGANSAIVWRGLMVMSAIQQLLRQVKWGPLHTLIVDMPPGTGDVQLSICQNVSVQGAIIVTTPQAVALSDVRRGIEMLNKVKVPIYGIVENMTDFLCPACGTRTPLFGPEVTDGISGVDQLAKETSLPVLGRIPIDPQLIRSCDSGRPLMISHPQSKVAQIYRELSEKILHCEQSNQIAECNDKPN